MTEKNRGQETRTTEPMGKGSGSGTQAFQFQVSPHFFFLTDQSQMIENKINPGSFYKPQFFILEDYFVIISFLLFFGIKMPFLYDMMLIVDGRSTFLI